MTPLFARSASSQPGVAQSCPETSFLGRVSPPYHILRCDILSVWDLLATDYHRTLIPSLLLPSQFIYQRDTISAAALNYSTAAKSWGNTTPASLGAALSHCYFFQPHYKFSVWLPQREAAASSQELGFLNISQATSRITDDAAASAHL